MDPCIHIPRGPSWPVMGIPLSFTLLIATLVSLESFQVFQGLFRCKKEVECRKQRETTASIHSLVKMQPWFLSLRWKTCLRQNCSPGSCASRTSFSNPYIVSATSQLILQIFHRLTYVTADSRILPLLHLRHRHFTYVTWRTVHGHQFRILRCVNIILRPFNN